MTDVRPFRALRYDASKVALADVLAPVYDVVVFHAGTKRAGGGFVTAGGRVLGVTARGPDVASAARRAYAAADRIGFEGKHMRRDVAARALAK